MTLVDAIRSGKKYRRKGSKLWLDKSVLETLQQDFDGFKGSYGGHSTLMFCSPLGEVPVLVGFSVADILSTDWETKKEEEKITITKALLFKALDVTCGDYQYSDSLWEELCK